MANIERLMAEGYEHLANGQFQKAIKVGRTLLKQYHTSGFEIVARAQWESGEPEAAIETLREGVEAAPDVPILWEFLAEYCSDSGLYEEALGAYRQALHVGHPDPSMIHYNLALVYRRQEEYELAELELAKAGEPDDELKKCHIHFLRADIRYMQKRYSEALTLLNEAIDLMGKLSLMEENEAELLAKIYAHRALIRWALEEDKETILQDIGNALELDKNQQTAFWLIRELHMQTSPDAKYYRLLLEGDWYENHPDDGSPLGFFITYYVIADSLDEALEYARSLEPEAVRNSLQIAESELIQPTPDAVKGVYEAPGGYTFYKAKKSRRG